MSNAEFRELLDLIMCSDPPPCEIDSLKHFAERQAKVLGYEGWLDAYHKLPRSSS